MGLPIVATDIRGCRQVVDDGSNGFLVPVLDTDALANALQKLGDDPDLRERASAASLAKSRREFDERNVVRIVMETYDRVAADRGLDHLRVST